MLNVIHSERVSNILPLAAADSSPAYFCIASFHASSDSILLKKAGLQEICIEQFNADVLAQAYIECIGELSSRHASLQWWAHPLSEKNEHLSKFFTTLCAYYALLQLIERAPQKVNSLFIVCPREMYIQLRQSFSASTINMRSLDNETANLLQQFKHLCLAYARLFGLFAKIVSRTVYVRFMLSSLINKALNASQSFYVIRTWLDMRFLLGGNDENDAYFGALPAHIRQRYPLMLFAGIISGHRKIFSKIRKALKDKKDVIVPEEYFIRMPDMFRSIGQFFLKKIALSPVILFMNRDISALIAAELKRGFISTSYALNIIRYYLAKRFAKEVNFTAYIQPFENYAWEKTSILGIKTEKPNAQVFGFQHAFISKHSFKYMLGRQERFFVPLPDTIITLGNVTKEILTRLGNHDPDRLKVGCALRQAYLSSPKKIARNTHSCCLLVPLTMVHSESLRILKFLHAAGLPASRFNVIIRPHPAVHWESIVKDLPFDLPQNFKKSTEREVKDDLKKTDIALYTWTTVAIEALKLGRPVIYLDILDPLFVDPLFECNALKKSVKRPEELVPAIQFFYDMDDETYYREQAEAQKYLKDYFYPLNDGNLAAFLPDGEYAGIQQ
jgi:hypothetical protein